MIANPTPTHEPRSAGAARASAFACVLGLALAAIVVLWPLVPGVASGVAAAPRVPAQDWARVAVSLLTSLGVAAAIATLATLAAWPIAWTLAGRGPARALAPVLLLPMTLPHTLAYTGWGVLRSPDTWLGDLIVAAAHDGARWLPVLLGRGLAIIGLALWAAPIAAIVLAVSFARTPRALLEQARVDARPGLRRHLALVGMHRAALLAAAAGVAALMLGSAVPLHLAQLPTHASVIWLDLAETAPGEWGGVWALALPAVALACLAAVPVARALTRARAGPRDALPGEPLAGAGPGGVIAALLVWAVALPLPLGLIAWTVSDWRMARGFVTLQGPALQGSLGVALAVGGVVAIATVLAGVGFAAPSRWLRSVTTLTFVATIAAALLPGVLVGAAFTQAWAFAPWLREHHAIVVLAHLARFMALGPLAAAVIDRLEPPGLRDLRGLEGGGGIGDWCRTVLPRRWPVVLGVALAAACLSLHEIEAAVMVQPPGPGNLARFVLDALHYARQDDLAGAVLTLAALAGVGGVAAAALVGAGFPTKPVPTRSRSAAIR